MGYIITDTNWVPYIDNFLPKTGKVDWKNLDESTDGEEKGYYGTSIYNDSSNGPSILAAVPLYAGAVSASWEPDASVLNETYSVYPGMVNIFSLKMTTENGDEIYPSGGILENIDSLSFEAKDYENKLLYVTVLNDTSIKQLSSSDEQYNDINKRFFYSNGETWIDIKNRYTNLTAPVNWSDSELNVTDDDEYEYIELIFSPKDDNFNCIAVEKVKTDEDYNTTYYSNGKVYYGVETSISEDSEVRSITNLLSTDGMIDVKTTKIDSFGNASLEDRCLSRIGVWGHSDALTAIDGEEFYIGPSGYYEIYIDDGEYNIKNFGTVVRGIYDKFLVDYEYPRLITEDKEK